MARPLHSLVVRSLVPVFCLLAATCSRPDDGARPARAERHAGLAGGGLLPGSTAPAPPARGTALGFVPAGSLLALRLPCAAGPAPWRDLALVQAAARLGDVPAHLLAAAALWQEGLPAGAAGLLARLQDALAGELVLAVLEVRDASRGRAARELPVVLAAFAELGDGAAGLDDALAALAAAGGVPGLRTPAPGRYEWTGDGARLDVLVREGWSCAWLGPESSPPGGAERLLATDPADSMLATDVVRNAPRADADGETAWCELFVDFDPLRALARRRGGAAAGAALASLRLDALSGLSVVSSLDGARFHDRFSLHSRGRADLVTALFQQKGIDPAWAALVLPDADSGGALRFDPGHALDTVRQRLPAGDRRRFETVLEEVARTRGVRLREDVLDLFGPHVVWSAKGDLARALADEEDLAGVLIVQLRNRPRVEQWLDVLLADAELPVLPQKRRVGDVAYRSVRIPHPEAPRWLEPSFGFVGGALVVATSAAAFEETVAVLAQPGTPPSWLAEALAAAGDEAMLVTGAAGFVRPRTYDGLIRIAVEEAGKTGAALPWLPREDQVAAFCAALPPEHAFLLPTGDGIRFESRGAFPGFLAAGPLAIAASVALPSLLKARIEANERATLATLQDAAALDALFRDDPDGTVLAHGYLHRALPAAPRRTGPAMRPAILAWPKQRGGTGIRVFVADAAGNVLVSPNDGVGQRYDEAHAPAPEAFEPARQTTAAGTWQGRDGGTWMRCQESAD